MSDYQLKPTSNSLAKLRSFSPPADPQLQFGGQIHSFSQTLKGRNGKHSKTPSIPAQPNMHKEADGERDFTEVFSWGSDSHGQLGLGEKMSKGKKFHIVPRFCSYNIPITTIACGLNHTLFVTTSHLVYSIGSNEAGQLGIDDPYVTSKILPVLVEGMLDKGAIDVKCGEGFSLALCRNGDVYSWGSNDFGQCGGGKKSAENQSTIFSPRLLFFENYYRPNIQQIDCGAQHSAFVDDIGRLFTCGRSNSGQLGLGYYADEPAPIYVNSIKDKVNSVACGESHTLALTLKGEVYAFGSNKEGQLGVQSTGQDTPLPVKIDQLKSSGIIKVRAGAFSAAISRAQDLFVWGSGAFGTFKIPHRVKMASKLNLLDFQVSNGGSALLLTQSGQVYSWGENGKGQLGLEDLKHRTKFTKVEALEGKRVSQVAMGNEFSVALGVTMPQREFIKRITAQGGILKMNGSAISTTMSLKEDNARPGGNPIKQYLLQNRNQVDPRSPKIQFEDEGKLADQEQKSSLIQLLSAAPSFKSGKRSKSTSKLGRSQESRRIRNANSTYITPIVDKSRSPIRSSNPTSLKKTITSRKSLRKLSSKSRQSGSHLVSQDRSTKEEPLVLTGANTQSLLYKPPSQVHDTVVQTLRRENEHLSQTLRCQKVQFDSLKQKLGEMTDRLVLLEKGNQEYERLHKEDERALLMLDDDNNRLLNENQGLRAQIHDLQQDISNIKHSENKAKQQAEATASKAADHKEDIELLVTEVEKLNDQLRSEGEARRHLEQTLATTQCELNQIKEDELLRTQKTMKELEHLKDLKDIQTSDNDLLRNKIEDLKHIRDELVERAELLDVDKRKLQSNLEASIEENQRLFAEIDSFKEDILSIEEHNKKLEDALRRMELENREMAEREKIQRQRSVQDMLEREARVDRVMRVLKNNEEVVSQPLSRDVSRGRRASQEVIERNSSYAGRSIERQSTREEPSFRKQRSSPLRRKSPAVNVEIGKSQDRISNILGLSDVAHFGGGRLSQRNRLNPTPSIKELLDSKRGGEYSPVREKGSAVEQSLAELKSRLTVMRKEKQEVDRSMQRY